MLRNATQPRFCVPQRPCSAANGSVDRGTYKPVPCKADSDCAFADGSCNGQKLACAKGMCGAAACTGSGAGFDPGTVGCGWTTGLHSLPSGRGLVSRRGPDPW